MPGSRGSIRLNKRRPDDRNLRQAAGSRTRSRPSIRGCWKTPRTPNSCGKKEAGEPERQQVDGHPEHDRIAAPGHGSVGEHQGEQGARTPSAISDSEQ